MKIEHSCVYDNDNDDVRIIFSHFACLVRVCLCVYRWHRCRLFYLISPFILCEKHYYSSMSHTIHTTFIHFHFKSNGLNGEQYCVSQPFNHFNCCNSFPFFPSFFIRYKMYSAMTFNSSEIN